MPTTLTIRTRPDGLELSWEAKAGRIYHVQKSIDLITWADFAGPYDGEDAMFVLPIQAQEPDAKFRIVVSVPNGYSVPTVAIVAFSGEYVQLQWENLGPAAYPAGAHYDILKDGQQYATRAWTESGFRDTVVASGRTYRYDVRFFS